MILRYINFRYLSIYLSYIPILASCYAVNSSLVTFALGS